MDLLLERIMKIINYVSACFARFYTLILVVATEDPLFAPYFLVIGSSESNKVTCIRINMMH